MSPQIHTYTEFRQQIHHDLRIQHPEWIEPNGESSMRLMELLDTFTRTESTNGIQRVYRCYSSRPRTGTKLNYPMKTYRNLSILIALAGALTLSVMPIGRADEKKKTDESKIQQMFVQTAEDLKADSNTLRLVNVGQQTLYFSDRPVRGCWASDDACLYGRMESGRRSGQLRQRPTKRHAFRL